MVYDIYEKDIAVGNAMIRHGGGFISALGRASLRADPDNLQRIKDAFPEYWEKYSKLADQAADQSRRGDHVIIWDSYIHGESIENEDILIGV